MMNDVDATLEGWKKYTGMSVSDMKENRMSGISILPCFTDPAYLHLTKAG